MFEELGDKATRGIPKELTATVGRLAGSQAQSRTEARVEELAQAQVRTEAQVGEPTTSQTQMQLQLAELTQVVRLLSLNGERHATRLGGVAGHVVVEVSVTCDSDDIDRVERRAEILRKAGLTVIPLVACEVIAPESLAYARSKRVRIWCNDTALDAAA